MTFPQWLDPTPITRQFVDGFADCPVREPFAGVRKKMLTGLSFKDSRLIGSQNGASAVRARALADAAARGETMIERHKRQRKEHYQRKKEYYAARYQAKKAAKLAGMPKL